MNGKPNITGYEKLVSAIESLLHESKSKYTEALRFIGMPGSIAANVRQIIYGLTLVLMMFKYSKGFISKEYTGQENRKF